MFVKIPPTDEIAAQVGLTGGDLDALAEDRDLKIYWIRGQRFLSASELFTAIHGSKVPRKFAALLADFQSSHEDLKPPGMIPLVQKIHSPDELSRYLEDLSSRRRNLYLTYTRETVNIYSVQS